jgi:Domain of unknown function (DUF4267)
LNKNSTCLVLLPKTKKEQEDNTIMAPPAYMLGAMCITLGLHSFLCPFAEYPRFGLPLEASPTPPTPTSIPAPNYKPEPTPNSTISPLIYLKSIRETTYGMAMIALQYQGQEQALTTMIAIISLAGLVDGFVVFNYGRDMRIKALGHWAFFFGFSWWAWWRAYA